MATGSRMRWIAPALAAIALVGATAAQQLAPLAVYAQPSGPAVALNPQPLPPRWDLNPQPPSDVSLYPQPQPWSIA